MKTITLQRRFRIANISTVGLMRSARIYVGSKNGSFYGQTYKEILCAFPKASIRLRIALVYSWMLGMNRPPLDSIENFVLAQKYPDFMSLTARNVCQIGDAFEKVEAELGSIAASKYLHFLFPNTFVMWDSKIQRYLFGKTLQSKGNKWHYQKYSLELSKKYHNAVKPKKNAASKYSIPRRLDMWLWMKSSSEP